MKFTGLVFLLILFLFQSTTAQTLCNNTYSWAKMIGGPGEDMGVSTATDALGNVYVTGDFNGVVVFDPANPSVSTISSKGVHDIFLAKFNSQGILLWVKSFGGLRQESSRGITLDAHDNIYLVGSFRSTQVNFSTPEMSTQVSVTLSNGYLAKSDMFVVKFNVNGQALWARSAIGTDNSGAYGVGIDNLGNVYVSGSISSAVSFGPDASSSVKTVQQVNGLDIFLVKYDVNGIVEWAKSAGSTSLDQCNGLAVDKLSGSCYLTGKFTNQMCFDSNCLQVSGDGDTYIAKYNTDGSNDWARGISCTGADVGTGVALDGNGRCYVSGTFKTQATFGNNLILNSSAGSAMFLACYNTSGEAVWAKKGDGNSSVDNVYTPKVDVNAAGSGYIGGYFTRTLTVGTFPAMSTTNEDMFVANFDENGNWLMVDRSLGASYERGADVAMDALGNCFIVGSFYTGTATIGTTSAVSKGNFDLFITRRGFTQMKNLGGDFLFVNSACATKFNSYFSNQPDYNILSYNWSFGDGSTSDQANPTHVYTNSGSYTVTLNVNYQFKDCSSTLTLTKSKTLVFNPNTDLLKDTTFNVTTELVEQVINSSVITFSDAWPLKHNDENLNTKQAYSNGAKGVWRAEENFTYDTERSSSSLVKLEKDGTYSLERFNFGFSEIEAIPKWRKVNTITQYSPYSYELENRDILNRYTAALYDYGGQFPSATGVNMRQQEMAFTSFEYMDGNNSGNWRLSNAAVPLYKSYTVHSGRDNYVIVQAPISEFDDATEVDVQGKSFFFTKQLMVQGNKIFCKKTFSQNSSWTVLYFERSITNLPWKGILIKRNQPQAVTQANLDETIAHTGKKSLKIATSLLTIKQELLQLEAEKAYLLSAWVSVNDFNLATPNLGTNIGIDIIFKDKAGIELQRFSFIPQGKIIEGWQQVVGEFVCPNNYATIETTFKPGSRGTAWYDDLRLQPVKGNMESYIYNLTNFHLDASLDENNFASFYYYDEEGRLYLTKKETEEGIKTISETVIHTPAKN